MSYRFNQLTGRLVGAAKSVGQGLKPAGPESSVIYNYDCKFTKVDNQQSRQSSSAGGHKYDPVDPKMLEKYAKFQKDDGIPVHLKGGMKDKVLYYFTLALVGYGLFEMTTTFYKMAQPAKKE